MCDDAPFLIHFFNIYIYNYIIHFGKFQEHFNSRFKMAHLPLRDVSKFVDTNKSIVQRE